MTKIKKIKQNILTKRGFTLIETMVAIFILTVSIGGPMTIVSKSLQASFFARDQITAFYLAGEAIELIRNRRDENTLTNPPRSWLDGLDACRGGNVCDVDSSESLTSNMIVPCASGTCSALLYDSATNFYNHISGSPSPFTREIRMETVTPDEETITVNVSWQTGLLTKNFDVKEHIFNWQQTSGGGPPLPSCGANQSDDLNVNTSGASVGGPGRTYLEGITIENTCVSSDITIGQIAVTWGNPPSLTEIRINGSVVWTGLETSGAINTIIPYIVVASGIDPIDRFVFDGDMKLPVNPDTFILTFIMSDGSSKTVGPFNPSP